MNIIVAMALIALTLLSRSLSFSLNFTPVLAIALFAGSYWLRGPVKFIMPLAGMILADLYFGFYPGTEWTYAAIALAVFLQPGLRPSVFKLAASSTLAAVVFFVVSNFGVWFTADQYPIAMYPKTWQGLVDCYRMGLLFFMNTLLSTWIFSTLFFGLHYLLTQAAGRSAIAYGRQKR